MAIIADPLNGRRLLVQPNIRARSGNTVPFRLRPNFGLVTGIDPFHLFTAQVGWTLSDGRRRNYYYAISSDDFDATIDVIDRLNTNNHDTNRRFGGYLFNFGIRGTEVVVSTV